MQQQKRLIGQRRDGLIAFLEIGEPDTDDNYAEKCVVGVVYASAKGGEPRSGDAVDQSIADVNAFVVVILEMLKIGAIRQVDVGRRPLQRGIDKLSILVDQRNEIGLRQVRQPLDKILISGLAATNTVEVVRPLRAAKFLFDFDFGQNQINRLYGACGLAGEHLGKVAGISECIGNRLRMQPPDCQRNCQRRRTDDTDRHGNKGTKN